MTAYYNEYEPYAVEWLRNLIKQGLIADGEVDGRSIVDVRADDLGKFTQCHFFAGIGVWSYALRLAGWPDDRPVWTGSCPCQPFSAAGKGAGFADERHLWPEFYRLISECRPTVVFGEQVASKDGLGWLDAVYADMEASGYAIGAADLCAAGVGAPHIRQRLWFVGERLADAHDAGLEGWAGVPERAGECVAGARSVASGLADTDSYGCGAGHRIRPNGQEHDAEYGSGEVGLADTTILGRGEGVTHDGRLRGGDSAEGSAGRSAVDGGLSGGLADAEREQREECLSRPGQGNSSEGGRPSVEPTGFCSYGRPSPTNGHWRAADWLHCRDGKWRPVEPGTFPLAHGAPARVGRLRAYGNAIVPQVAAEIIQSFMECRP